MLITVVNIWYRRSNQPEIEHSEWHKCRYHMKKIMLREITPNADGYITHLIISAEDLSLLNISTIARVTHLALTNVSTSTSLKRYIYMYVC